MKIPLISQYNKMVKAGKKTQETTEKLLILAKYIDPNVRTREDAIRLADRLFKK